jgi:hypothetical protein
MKELRRICKGERGADALHDGGHDLGSATYELILVYSEAEVSVGIVGVSLFEVFFDGFEVVKKGVGAFLGVMLQEVRFVKVVGDGERRQQLHEILLE